MQSNSVFLNLPVKSLTVTRDFWSALGFSLHPKFNDSRSACVILRDGVYAMFVIEQQFRRYMPKDISQTAVSAEAVFGLQLSSKEEVDAMAAKAVAAGGREYRVAYDFGTMYGKCAEDLDGHLWEFFWMDDEKTQVIPD